MPKAKTDTSERVSATQQITLSGIRDNHRRGTVGDFLRDKIQAGSKLSIVSAYFTIYAYEALKKQLEPIDELRFLFGEPRSVKSLDPEKTEVKSFMIDRLGLKLDNHLEQKRVAKECADWIKGKAAIRSVKQSNLLHGKMYHVSTKGLDSAILGSSNFTVRGLGLGPGGHPNSPTCGHPKFPHLSTHSRG